MKVPWRRLFYSNVARPRASFTMWLCFLEKIPTKDRLMMFGMITDDVCVLCGQSETLQHLMSACVLTRGIWCQVLQWLKCAHARLPWSQELQWIIKAACGNSWHCKLIRAAVAETIYDI